MRRAGVMFTAGSTYSSKCYPIKTRGSKSGRRCSGMLATSYKGTSSRLVIVQVTRMSLKKVLLDETRPFEAPQSSSAVELIPTSPNYFFPIANGHQEVFSPSIPPLFFFRS
uniref:(northern house mosquito) hypothetical protein n=1 Tax=Culex pipiens TaxID=7175 RepID=A0A8D8BD71_CULPI